jgi:hypothetical protein
LGALHYPPAPRWSIKLLLQNSIAPKAAAEAAPNTTAEAAPETAFINDASLAARLSTSHSNTQASIAVQILLNSYSIAYFHWP